MTRDDIKVTKGQDCFVVTVNVSADDNYSLTYTEDVSRTMIANMLAEYIMSKELGICSHDILMVMADAEIR